jgi:1,4-alpha-glucan branching enzyme
MVIQNLVRKRALVIETELKACVELEKKVDSLSPEQLRLSKIALDKVRLYGLTVLVCKVINFIVKIFSKKFNCIDDLLAANNLAIRTIQNYTLLSENSNAEIDDAGFTYDISFERLKKDLPAKVDGPIRVTMVGVEYAGLMKQGGLAEAIEGLSRALVGLNNTQVQLIFPKYSHLPEEAVKDLQGPETHMNSDGESYQVYRKVINGVDCQFIAHPTFDLEMDQPNVYGPDFTTQMKRFATFSGLAADLIREQKKTDVLHLHDWHVAGVGLKLKKDCPQSEVPPVVFTFHNNQRAMQGRLGSGAYTYDPVIRGYQNAGIIKRTDNLFVRTLLEADAVTTVSERFGVESQEVEQGEGVSFAIRRVARMGKLTGILNGANLERWNPKTDASLLNWKDVRTGAMVDLSYGADSQDLMEKKASAREQLGKWIGKYAPEVKVDLTKPIVTYIGRFDSRQKGIERFEEAIDATLKQGGQFICMGTDEDGEATKILNLLQEKYKTGVFFIRDHRNENGRLYFQQGDGERPGIGSLVRAVTDFTFIPSKFEPCGLVQFEGWCFGSLAIGAKTGGLADSIRETNGYLFEDRPGKVVEKALKDWNGRNRDAKAQAIRRVMHEVQDAGWKKAAEQYRLVYTNALKQKTVKPISTLQGLKYRSLAKRVTPDPVVVQEERYLAEHYLQNRDSRTLEASYRDLPEEIRVNVPSPYGKGVDFTKHEQFGAFLEQRLFRVSAPHAKKVELLLNGQAIPMVKDPNGVWTKQVDSLVEGQKYQYRVDGTIKIDPYGRLHVPAAEPQNPPYSVVTATKHSWSDEAWIKDRSRTAGESKPMSIYEVHPVSWKKRDEKPLNYRELAHELVSHCQQSGYTHVELMGILEHPRDKSLGYQVSGFFAPTSRMGTVDDFKYLVDLLHKNKIGVILDWVPAHFDRSSFGLSQFDGSPQYEAHGLGYLFSIRNWFFKYSAKHFNFGQKEVRDFLISSAMYWTKEMHIDALRVDCVRSMLSTEDSRSANLFMRDLNAVIHSEGEGAITIAEEFSGDRRVTASSAKDGLDFDMKWHAGFMHHMMSYFSLPLNSRPDFYEMIEQAVHCDDFHRQILFLSHDQAEKYFELNQLIADQLLKEAQARAMWSLMMCLPGKKLNFMATEGASQADWRKYAVRKDRGWFDEYQRDPKFLAMTARLNEIYKGESAFHEFDANGKDLEWIADPNRKLHAYRRKNSKGESFICVHNFGDVEAKFESENKVCKEIFNSDAREFGGKGGTHTEGPFKVPPLSTIILKEHSCA